MKTADTIIHLQNTIVSSLCTSLRGAGWVGLNQLYIPYSFINSLTVRQADEDVIQRREGLVVLLTSEFSYGISDEIKFEPNFLRRIMPWESIG